MNVPTTLGRAMLAEVVPAGTVIDRPWTKDQSDEFLGALMTTRPEDYRDISKRIMDLAREAVYSSGVSLGVDDLDPVIDTKPYIAALHVERRRIDANRALTPRQKHQEFVKAATRTQKAIVDATYNAALAAGNPLAEQVRAKARGNQSQLTAILSTPGIYEDAKGEVIPLFVENSYADGLTPAEYYATTYGARKSVISTKFSTAEAGYLGKQLNSSLMPLKVTEDDCGAAGIGMPVPVGDVDNIGALLAQDAAGFKAGTPITPSVLAELKKQVRDDEILVRSPVTCRTSGGICAHCAGIRESGTFPKIGDFVGINAGAAIAERMAQGSLNTKHCIPIGYTKIRKLTGAVVDIGELRVGDQIQGKEQGARVPATVVDIIPQGSQAVWEYGYRVPGGRKVAFSLRCTEEHVVDTPDGPLPASAARWLSLPREDNTIYTAREPNAFFVGFYLGDGIRWDDQLGTAATGTPSVRVSCAEPAVVDGLNTELHNLGICLRKRKRSHDYAVVLSHACASEQDAATGRFVDGYRNPVRALLTRLGLNRVYAHDKKIPDEVWTWHKDDVAALLSGFLTSDGSLYTSGTKSKIQLAMSSCSLPLLDGLRELLLFRFGVLTTACTCINKAGNGNRKHDQWQFTLSRPGDMARLLPHLRTYGHRAVRLRKLREQIADVEPVVAPIVLERIASTPLGEMECMDITVTTSGSMFSLANGLIIKNSGGMGGMMGDSDYAGFPFVEQFTQVPQEFPYGATVAAEDGRVEAIEAAPQGGSYIVSGKNRYFVRPGLVPRVKEGDTLYAGDQLSSGLANPRDVVQHKGIGEGRRYYASRLTQMLRDSKYAVNRRNVEVLSRMLVNHVVNDDLEDEGDAMPGDVMDYSGWAASYAPRADAQTLSPDKAVGRYLEAPALHYTVGTRITPAVAAQLRKFKQATVMAHDTAPSVRPHMLSLREVPQNQPDWMAQLGSNYLKKNLLHNVHTGAVSDTMGAHPIPRIAAGTLNTAQPKPRKKQDEDGQKFADFLI